MLTFTDPKKYVMGIGTAYATSLVDGSIKFWSDKFTEGNTSFSASEMINNAGIGNGPAIIMYNDPNITVSFTQADYNEYIRAAATGAAVTYGAPVEKCQTITASGTSLTVNVADGIPVAGLGMAEPKCYVQEIGAASPVTSGGVAYAINPTTGAINGFAATNGKQYLVTYFVAQANASLTTYGTNFNSDVVRFVYRRPVYTNFNPSTNSGDLAGWKIDVIPFLKLNPATATDNGSQSSYTTTAIAGRAIAYEDAVITGECNDCTLKGAPLMYSVYAPCDDNAGIGGILGVLGGSVSLKTGATVQLTPAIVVNNTLSYGVPPTAFTYSSSKTSVATVGAATGIVTGVTAGSAEITVTYVVGSTTYTDFVNIEVTSA